MKIDYLSSSAVISDAANAVHVMRMANALASAGHEVTLHAVRGDGSSDADVFAYYGSPSTFQLVRHVQESALLPRLLSCLRVLRLPLGPIMRLTYAKARIGGDLTTNALLYARNLEWLAGAVTRQSRFIIESHAPPGGHWQRLLYGRLFRHEGFLALVVISKPLKAAFLSCYPFLLDPAKIIVAHDGADEVAELAPTANQRIQLGYVGHLYSGRGGELMVELARRLPQADVHLVGGRENDIARLKALHPPSNLVFHGHQPPARLAEYFARFDVLLAPYQRQVAVAGGGGNTVAFMSPLKIFEYMAWGRAIIASNLAVLHEVLTPEQTALMVDPDDTDGWVAAVRRLEDAPELREKLGVDALRVFKSHYSWKSRARRILAAALPAADEL